ncbi:MAG: hypothetical protein GXO64_00755 [Candidatus Micrarchaeota archaeon]|nr:hypothetical protein [Candidatus Micrarchaeota archaeon]
MNNPKGQMYSIIAMVLVMPMVLFLSMHLISEQEGRGDIYKGIVAEQMAIVRDSMESDFEKAMEISAERAFISATNWEILQGTPLEDAVSNVTTLMIAGTINGTQNLIMIDNTITDWSSKISEVETNFETNISFNDMHFSSYAFTITVSSDVNISVNDETTEMRIDIDNMEKEVNISIENLDDPLYPLNTYGILQRTIVSYPYPYNAKKLITGGVNSSGSCSGEVTTDPADTAPSGKILLISDAATVSDSVLRNFAGIISENSINLSLSGISCYNTGNGSAIVTVNGTINGSDYDTVYIDEETAAVWHLPFREAVEDGYYFVGIGPNITNRMENSTMESTGGIESIVNIQDLSMEGLPVRENQVTVDYLYFANETYIGYSVRGFPGWFKLNCEKAQSYGLTELLEHLC